MARVPITVDLLANLLSHVPEGFIGWSQLQHRYVTQEIEITAFAAEAATQGIEFEQWNFFDANRLTHEEVRRRQTWCRPQIPSLDKQGRAIGPTIREQQAARRQRIAGITDPVDLTIIHRVDHSLDGFLWSEALQDIPGTHLPQALSRLNQNQIVATHSDFVYDPLRLTMTNNVVGTLRSQREYTIKLREAEAALAARPFDWIDENEWERRFTQDQRSHLLAGNLVTAFTVKSTIPPRNPRWYARIGTNLDAARSHAGEQVKASDNGWKPMLALCGDVMREGAREGKTSRTQVIAHSYLTIPAARRIGLPERALSTAIRQKRVPAFIDPEGRLRLAAATVEQLLADEDAREQITAFITLKPRDLAVACSRHRSTIRSRLLKLGLSTTAPTWGDVRGRWELPATYAAYRKVLDEKWQAILGAVRTARAEQHRLREEQHARELAERAALRERLIAAFPDWRHDGRSEQRVIISTGPANSGKTHAALERLIAAGSGWYLAPLRLLAYEIYDRLNQRGVACNLLTGEESLPVDGARVTSATIEMFNPLDKGACVIIDEAQMLSDSDRGWAWTRALMEARAPEIHVLGSPAVQPVVERLLNAAAQPFAVRPHERLAPLCVAPAPWKLNDLPAQSILVAFSRQSVLDLKTILEGMGRRVSVIYGALPPEVRRRQADRFAAGETEICVATDAVGMGLNLPAEYVCFYEVRKFDGRIIRPLTTAEVHQIGGRAGRYGFSAAGTVGALNKLDHSFIRLRFEQAPEVVKHAYVAPSVADLSLLPGRLAARLRQWGELESIPPALRPTITTAGLGDRIMLAQMLSPDEEERLGLAPAIKLTNAPVRRESVGYWRACATAILADDVMLMPPDAPEKLANSRDLERAEYVVACADLYLWLARTPEFTRNGPAYDEVRAARYALSQRIDDALASRVDTRRRCSSCGRILPLHHRYRLCDGCHFSRRYDFEDYLDEMLGEDE